MNKKIRLHLESVRDSLKIAGVITDLAITDLKKGAFGTAEAYLQIAGRFLAMAREELEEVL